MGTRRVPDLLPYLRAGGQLLEVQVQCCGELNGQVGDVQTAGIADNGIHMDRKSFQALLYKCSTLRLRRAMLKWQSCHGRHRLIGLPSLDCCFV